MYVLYDAWAEIDESRRPLQIAYLALAKLENPEEIQATRERVLAWSDDPAIDCILLIEASPLGPSLGLGTSPDHLRCYGTWRTLELE
jgi:hypothetical protein